MAIAILMPALSPTMTEGNLAKWLKKEGDKIKPGDVIAEIETDKATMEVEAADSGVLGKIVISANTSGVKVNQLIAVLQEAGEGKKEVEALIAKHQAPQAAPIKTEEKAQPANIASAIAQPTVASGQSSDRVFASPLAKRIAANEGINLTGIQGSGPHGRIVKADVVNHKPNSAMPQFSYGRNAQEYTMESLSQMRKVIAKRLVESKQTVPHFYLTVECQLDNLMALRDEINKNAPKNGDTPLYKISVNDFIIKAAAHALRAVPGANSSWSDDGIIRYNNIDISVAVAIDEGLITPIVRNADQKSLGQISNEVKELAKRARVNALKPEEFQGGSFSISNLGMYGIKEFKAIINPPQACILAVGAAEKRPVIRDDKIEIATLMTISLSCDHRVVDGTMGAELLNACKQFIQNPALMLV
jgi:pyruvate dehydrogenase E2 component (dihydrolipoamide acetyltransferase)